MKAPKFKTKPDGTRIFEPDFALKEKIGGINIEKLITPEVVKAAEEIINQGKERFAEEILTDIRGLRNSYREFSKDADMNTGSFGQMVDTALNIKSCGGMYGYDLATEVAKSLFEFCMEMDHFDNKSLQIINIHIDALEKIFAYKIMGLGGKKGEEVLSDLAKLTGVSHHKKEEITAEG